MALKYRIMTTDRYGTRSIGMPDFAEYEAAADRRRVLEADGKLYSILTVDVPTGTTPAQDRMVRLVRDVRYRQRLMENAPRGNTYKAQQLRAEPLVRRLELYVRNMETRLGRMHRGWNPQNLTFYEFYLMVRTWLERARTINQAHRLAAQAADRLVPPETLPVPPDAIAEMERQQAADAQSIDGFIHAYDTAEPKA